MQGIFLCRGGFVALVSPKLVFPLLILIAVVVRLSLFAFGQAGVAERRCDMRGTLLSWTTWGYGDVGGPGFTSRLGEPLSIAVLVRLIDISGPAH